MLSPCVEIGDLQGLVDGIQVLAIPAIWEAYVGHDSILVNKLRYGLGPARASVERVRAGED